MKTIILLASLFTVSAFAQTYKVVESYPAREDAIKYFCQFAQKQLKSEKRNIDMTDCLSTGKQQDFVEGKNYDNVIIHGDVLSEGKSVHCSWFVRLTVQEAVSGMERKVICE